MSSDNKEKVKNILERLALEVVGDDSIPKLAKKLNLTKQTLYGWVKDEKIVIESVKSKIPNVNPKFLRFGEGEPLIDDLYESEVSQLENRIADEGKPDNARGLYIEALEAEAERISNDLQGLVGKLRKLRRIDD